MSVVTFLSGQVMLCGEPYHDLEQIILLLLNPLGFHVILVCPFN
jgi:hypothetical protein